MPIRRAQKKGNAHQSLAFSYIVMSLSVLETVADTDTNEPGVDVDTGLDRCAKGMNGGINIDPYFFHIYVQAPVFVEKIVKTDLKGGTEHTIIIGDRVGDSRIVMRDENKADAGTDIGGKRLLRHKMILHGQSWRQDINRAQIKITRSSVFGGDIMPRIGKGQLSRNIFGKEIGKIQVKGNRIINFRVTANNSYLRTAVIRDYAQGPDPYHPWTVATCS